MLFYVYCTSIKLNIIFNFSSHSIKYVKYFHGTLVNNILKWLFSYDYFV